MTLIPVVTQAQLDELHSSLTNRSGLVPLSSRFRSLFTLRSLGNQQPEAILSIVEALRPTKLSSKVTVGSSSSSSSPDALLGHELAYCLGQIGDPIALPVLEDTLRDHSVHPMVRHEAAEAMGAIGDPISLKILREFINDPEVSVRETCELAIEKILGQGPDRGKRFDGTVPRKGEYGTIDPTPSMIESFDESEAEASKIDEFKLKKMTEQLLDQDISLFQRYRAMFGLRDAVGRSADSNEALALSAVEALTRGFNDRSALFRHEIAYVFGQLSHPASVPALLKVLQNEEEEEMVRHEAAEALGSIATPEVLETLNRFRSSDEPSQVVRESCEVALDMYEYERSKEFQYTLPLNNSTQQ
ncbi:deoxyhypusine hydroxylase [Phakopsora pachyrhizi]|uniref:Deoxyhypusine hydroxylase n=1 Tax=Phakopsora pachyrhizi TaxID=170000 RepID=A0AAV0APZ3_PHAPC|nr:deoxyhypusine hydroxylase [Phakopsora pachyrhizi]